MNASLRLLLHFLWITFAFGGNVLYRWKWMDFNWESKEQMQRYIEEGGYDKTAITPIDVYKSSSATFVTIVRDKGVPASLVTLDPIRQAGGGPRLNPFPNWSWTNSSTCDKTIVSVYRVTEDKCKRLWVLDTGKDGETQECPPKIMSFDQTNNRLLSTTVIPNEYAFNKNGTGLLVTPVVETYDRNCNKMTIYMADVEGYGLVVMNEKHEFKRFDSPVFAAQNPNFMLSGVSFYLPDGVLGLALTEGFPNERKLYFSALTSYSVDHVLTKELQIGYNQKPNYVVETGDVDFRKAPLVIVSDIMYFGSLEDTALLCWNMKKSYNKENMKTIDQNSKTMQFISGLKNKGNCIYGLSNKYQKAATNSRNISEYNYYVFEYCNVERYCQ